MIISTAATDDKAESWTASCDADGEILDPGAADAPKGGYPTQRAAQDAAEAHGWHCEHSDDFHLCPPCAVEFDVLTAEVIKSAQGRAQRRMDGAS